MPYTSPVSIRTAPPDGSYVCSYPWWHTRIFIFLIFANLVFKVVKGFAKVIILVAW